MDIGMYEDFYNLKLTEKYQPGLLDYSKYANMLDVFPDWPDYHDHGISWNRHLKINKLIAIEHIKYMLESEDMDDNDRKMGEEVITKMIEEYNKMEA